MYIVYIYIVIYIYTYHVTFSTPILGMNSWTFQPFQPFPTPHEVTRIRCTPCCPRYRAAPGRLVTLVPGEVNHGKTPKDVYCGNQLLIFVGCSAKI